MTATPRNLEPNLHSHEHGAGHTPGWIWLLPAYTVVPFVRSTLGYDIVHPFRAVLMPAVGLAVVPLVVEFFWEGFGGKVAQNLGYFYLAGFAALYFIVSCVLFFSRSRTHDPVHTADAGYSFVSQHSSLPPWLCELIIMPAAIGAVGYALYRTLSWELGVWLMLAAASYMLMSKWEISRRRSQKRMMMNDVKRAKILRDLQEKQEGAPSKKTKKGRDPNGSSAMDDDVATLGSGRKTS